MICSFEEGGIIIFYEEVFDVIIGGGGVSGALAAIAAGRSGAKVLIIEQSGYLGGSLTGAGVGPMMTFHAGEKQVIKGLPEEIVQNMVKRGFSAGHVKDTTRYVSYVTPFSSEGLKLILDEMTREANVKVLYHTFLGAVRTEGGRIASLTVCNKDGLNQVKGKVFVDATGDGDIAAWAGVPMTKGREVDGATQPMTMNMKYCNVDTNKLKKHIISNVGEFDRLKDNQDLMNLSTSFCVAGFKEEFKAARERKEIGFDREELLFFETNRPGEYIINTSRILEKDGTDAESLSEAEIIGRRQCAQLDIFLRKHIPGFENALLEYTGPSVGVRGSRQLVGEYTLTAEDILSRKEFETTIAHSAYPIDIHNPKGAGTNSMFLSEKGTYYSIPYEVMTCKELSNLLVVGRCISATFEAQAAIRVTPTAGAIGQAGGIAAALCALEYDDVHKVNVSKLQEELLKQGAYLERKTYK